MASILWIVVIAVACVWVASAAAVAVLAVGAHRGDPRVVMDDPWERQHDFSRWEHEMSWPGPRVERIAPRRPRPAA
jgi:hypothetical protein